MANIFPAVTRVDPNFFDPRIIVQYNQASGAFDMLAGGDPEVRLPQDAQYVYMPVLQVRSKVAAGTLPYNFLPSCDLVYEEIGTPTYLMRVVAEYDHRDIAAGARRNVSVPNGQSLAMRQGHFQQQRHALIFGFNPQNGEGIANTQGATAVTLPADSFGHTTTSTYDNGEMAFFLLSQVQALKTRMYQMGLPARVVIVGPQRTIGPMEYQDIVQVTQYQRQGAGSLSVRQTLEAQLSENGDSLAWTYDDTLQGKGLNGADLVLMVIPEIKRPNADSPNTNIFATLQPGMDGTTLQYMDMAAPREIPTPIVNGGIHVLSELRITSGWGVRPEAITVLTMPF